MSQNPPSRPDDAINHRAIYNLVRWIADTLALFLVLLFKKYGTRGKNATTWDGAAALILYPYLLAQFWVPKAQNLLTFPESFCLIYGSFLVLFARHRFSSLYERYVKRNIEHTAFVGVSIFESKGRNRNSALLYEIMAGLALAGAGFFLSTSIGGFLLVSSLGLAVKNLVMIVEVHALSDAISDAEIEADWVEKLRRR